MTTAELIIALAGIVFGATGFWTFLWQAINKRSQKHDSVTKLILGLGHEKILELSFKYIKRGYITEDEYGDLMKYLYEPYIELGGDGTVEKIVEGEIKKLPIKRVMIEGGQL